MKKLLCLILAAMLLFCACGSDKDDGSTEPVDFEIQYPTVSPTEPEDPQAILAYRRDVVEQAMREQSSILWRPAQTFSYSLKSNSGGVALDIQSDPDQIVTLYADRIYQGIPYTHGSGSYYSWLSFATAQDEHGVYTLTGITDQHLTGTAGNRENRRARLGNDCADQLFWAWSRISNSIDFHLTVEMTELHGCLKVGDYEYTGANFSGENNTKDIVAQNGEQRMFAAYAKLQKGDGMVLINKYSEGHAVMVVSSHPVYKSDGTIDGEKSYVTVLEQTSGNEANENHYYNEELGQEVYLCEVMDKEWTYDTLIKKAYLPITCKELIDPAPREEPTIKDYTDAPTVDNMFKGIVESNYRISSVTVTISRDGETVQQATCFGHQDEMFSMNLYRFTKEAEAPVIQGSISLDDLPAGTYTCSFTARLSTGDNPEFRNFTFTK